MKNLSFILLLISILTSCSNAVRIEENESFPEIGVYVEVGEKSKSRTITDTSGGAAFVKNDCIGLFVSGIEKAVVWKFDGNEWNTDLKTEWKNKTDNFEFCAFYPCHSENITREAIPMPDLAVQSGKLQDIGKYDFLVGRCISSYYDNDGIVSFTGKYSLRHIYSLLHLEIVSQEDYSEVTITGSRFTGNGIVKHGNYVFSKNEEDKILMSDDSEGNVLDIYYEKPQPVTDKFEIFVLLNPVSLESPLEFSLFYEKDGTEYVAEVGLIKNLAQGSYNRIKLNWVKDGLIICDNKIDNWNLIMIDDISFNGYLK